MTTARRLSPATGRRGGGGGGESWSQTRDESQNKREETEKKKSEAHVLGEIEGLQSQGPGLQFGGLYKIIVHLETQLKLIFPTGPLKQRIRGPYGGPAGVALRKGKNQRGLGAWCRIIFLHLEV